MRHARRVVANRYQWPGHTKDQRLRLARLHAGAADFDLNVAAVTAVVSGQNHHISQLTKRMPVQYINIKHKCHSLTLR